MFSNRKRSAKSQVSSIQSISILLLLVSCSSSGQKVVSCNDGDTCRVERNGIVEKIRLSGIDAPETGQVLADESRDFLLSFVKGKKVDLSCDGTSYDRKTCTMSVGGVDVQQKLVEAGLALDSPKYSDGKYAKFQKDAKSKKLGIWKLENPLSPHCYRNMPKKCNSNRMFQP
jgi:micrococcal nuclease